MLTIGFIGAGTTGTALALCLYKQGYKINAVYSRTQASAERLASKINGCEVKQSAQDVINNCKMIFITTPDDVILDVCQALKWRNDQYVIHCSGAHSTEILDHAIKMGAKAGGFHPLQTFAGIEQAIYNIPGSTFALEADEPLLTELKKMAISLGGNWIILKPEHKSLYHISAVFISNYLVTLTYIASTIWKTWDIDQSQAINALLPLLKGTLQNIQNIGLPNCLTGPIARGDSGTIKKHIDSLKDKYPELLDCYKILGKNTIPVALAKGKINEKSAAILYEIFE